ncbi:hypothetical protein GLOTRDRAFT_72347 [Gloeophyllum trabeum ATCC 11539]|uniref:Phosphatidylinositol N-acetylglucosaminyltransferase subunit H conserved domain-containing protein n=1 Tax=Gloeophyllum trabeum (strain ATCC 11539 / FP-39264 / Madison 617) TaxID=670483 RepID=S7RU12_GLOTA|nr:uncharacterized protein GLOTRDRAFT_72347 [Gloeophyllum trabeum ATCC 11539]EPQ58195.1 hypothetical protein GLOTRDRAFT_72347 [Gloeophyllum trabeum ATCC 11539]
MRSWRQPLPLTNPEFTVHEWPGYCEYRVENWHLARDGSGRVVEGYRALSWKDAVFSVIIAVLWPLFRASLRARIVLVIVLAFMLWSRCSQVLWESVISIPPHGIQLETHKGYPSMPLYAVRRFIPSGSLKDFIINEGLQRWNVRYYLSAIRRTSCGAFTMEIAYNDTLPHFPILLEVYRGIHETELFSQA